MMVVFACFWAETGGKLLMSFNKSHIVKIESEKPFRINRVFGKLLMSFKESK